MTAFTIIDAGGIARTVNLSNDTRFPLAMDALPRNMSRRRPARDEEQGEMPESIDAATAVTMIGQILARCDDPDRVLEQVQQGSERSDESAIDAGTEFPVRPGYVPAASGKTRPKLDMNARRASMDAALAMDKQDPRLASYLDRIRLGGR
jgi:hypothetical protein